MRALILGITGQDGSCLAKHLCSLGYEVHGVIRRSSAIYSKIRLEEILPKITLHYGDILDPLSISAIIDKVEPHEIYNEADQDNVDFSFKTPSYSVSVSVKAVVDLIESIRQIDSSIRLFQPCSCLMFGNTGWSIQDEHTPLCTPQSPYAAAKQSIYNICKYYRECIGMYIGVGILYNHDHETRGDEYLLHIIYRHIEKNYLDSGTYYKPSTINIYPGSVDIGYAPEFVEMFPRILEQSIPQDFCLASGKTYEIIGCPNSLCSHAVNRFSLNAEELFNEAKSNRPGNPTVYTSRCEKAREQLGFNPISNALSVLNLLLDRI